MVHNYTESQWEYTTSKYFPASFFHPPPPKKKPRTTTHTKILESITVENWHLYRYFIFDTLKKSKLIHIIEILKIWQVHFIFKIILQYLSTLSFTQEDLEEYLDIFVSVNQ